MSNLLRNNRDNGFTLLELVLAIALIAVLAGTSIPIYQSFQTRNDLNVSVDIAVQALRRAQILAQAVSGDTSWGVKIQSGSIVIFKGAGYAARDASYDEIYEISNNITPSGNTEIIFEKFTGASSATGATTLALTNGETKTITINSKGTVDF